MSSELFVYKFGGSSIRDAKAIKDCAFAVLAEPNVKIVIVSATYNTTNFLEKLAKTAISSLDEAKGLWHSLVSLHEKISTDLEVASRFEHYLSLINAEAIEHIQVVNRAGKITRQQMAIFYSYGERLSSRLFVAALKKVGIENIEHVDATDIITTDSSFLRAIPDPKLIKKNAKRSLMPPISEGKIIVTQGFIGKDIEGRVTTLGREGSDYSATLFAEAVDASKVVIWTDVPGIFTVDPRLYKKAESIKKMSYDHAGEMARLGAKVLFPQTLDPAKRSEIPVFVKSIKMSDRSGTKITGKIYTSGPVGISYEKGVLSVIGNDLSEDLLDLPLVETNKNSLSYKCDKENLLEAIEFIHSEHLL